MGCCPSKTVIAGLEKKGFRAMRKTKHVMYVYYTTSGKKTPIRTQVSMSPGKELSASLIALMSIQVKLKVSEFEDLCKCPLSQDNYESKLCSEGCI